MLTADRNLRDAIPQIEETRELLVKAATRILELRESTLPDNYTKRLDESMEQLSEMEVMLIDMLIKARRVGRNL